MPFTHSDTIPLVQRYSPVSWLVHALYTSHYTRLPLWGGVGLWPGHPHTHTHTPWPWWKAAFSWVMHLLPSKKRKQTGHIIRPLPSPPKHVTQIWPFHPCFTESSFEASKDCSSYQGVTSSCHLHCVLTYTHACVWMQMLQGVYVCLHMYICISVEEPLLITHIGGSNWDSAAKPWCSTHVGS